jgi:hypothetical protein
VMNKVNDEGLIFILFYDFYFFTYVFILLLIYFLLIDSIILEKMNLF